MRPDGTLTGLTGYGLGTGVRADARADPWGGDEARCHRPPATCVSQVLFSWLALPRPAGAGSSRPRGRRSFSRTFYLLRPGPSRAGQPAPLLPSGHGKASPPHHTRTDTGDRRAGAAGG